MRNISFSNPLWLLAIIPLAILVILPYLLAIRKENRSKSATVSIILHILIILCVIFGVAGTIVTTVMTETSVYVVADVSYSANRNLDRVDGYIRDLSGNLPDRSKMGVVAFGKDQKLITDLGGEFLSVKDSGVDDSATNIADALDYTAGLFEESVIKRIVLITDGKETDTGATQKLIATIENLYNKGVYVDAIYLNDNLPEDAKELQISGVTCTGSTYRNHDSSATVMVQSSYEAQAILSLYQGENKIKDTAVTLMKGFNIVNFELDTSKSGVYDYTVRISGEEDTSPYNNEYRFTQEVHGNINVLLITSKQADVDAVTKMYGEDANIESYVNRFDVPFTVEDLCGYDEIVLANTDVRKYENFTSFVESLDTVVSLFGKSLVTVGNVNIQNQTDDVLKDLEDMLPVRFGNNDGDPKLYTLVIDVSRSMQNAYRLLMAKQAAIELLSLMKPTDMVAVVAFSGRAEEKLPPTSVLEIEKIMQVINDLPPTQGTNIGSSLKVAYNLIKPLDYTKKEVILISDGMSYSGDVDNPTQVAGVMKENGIVVSTINTASQEGVKAMTAIANSGAGNAYYLKNEQSVEELILGEVADDITESVIEETTEVQINLYGDSTLQGITSVPTLGGYLYSSAKGSAKVVLSTTYKTESGLTTYPPIYAYWGYGNGKVACYTSEISGNWAAEWQSGAGEQFLSNVADVNIPAERIHHPYTLTVEYDGTYSSIVMTPVVLNPSAKVELTVTRPGGEVINETPIFNASGYAYRFTTSELGKYEIKIVYSYDDKSYETHSFFNISYSPEYDSFVTFDASNLYEVVRNRGTVSEDGKLTVVNDESEVATYTVDFTSALLAIAVVLYVVDIIVRKIKWNDITTLFKKKKV